jgi:hypothetical protein
LAIAASSEGRAPTHRWTRAAIECFASSFIESKVGAGARPRQLHRYTALLMTLEQAIRRAEQLMPGSKPPKRKRDPVWQAIIKVSMFIETHPKELWAFISKWGRSDNENVRTAVAVLVLEDFLGFHFDDYFPLVEELVKSDRNFADTFSRCWKFDQSQLPENAARFDRLQRFCSAGAV